MADREFGNFRKIRKHRHRRADADDEWGKAWEALRLELSTRYSPKAAEEIATWIMTKELEEGMWENGHRKV